MPSFELLAGRHTSGTGISGTRVVKIPGDIIEARSEKEAAFMRKYPDKYKEVNPRPSMKNRPVVGPTSPERESEEVVEVDLTELEKMDAKHLAEFAKKNDIDIKGATRREAILQHIKNAIT